jgi:fructoselysine-6-P-deglycase FrlB-like protein
MAQTTEPSAPAEATPGHHMAAELASQPDVWEQAIAQARSEQLMPADGTRVAVIGCGTSWFMAQAYAAAREAAGRGETDAFAASEASVLATRSYDSIVAITRSWSPSG